jgi:hypothetical protein
LPQFKHCTATLSRRRGIGNSQFVEEDAVVVLTTGITATSGMLSVLSYTTVAHAHVTALVAGFLEVRHLQSNSAKSDTAKDTQATSAITSPTS